jgi:hypothetical protein
VNSPFEVNYEPTWAETALRQVGGLPGDALGALAVIMVDVCTNPIDPLRTFPTDDPYFRRAQFGWRGSWGMVSYRIDDAAGTVKITDVTWAG